MTTKEPKTVIDFDKYQVSAIPLEKAMTEGVSAENPRAFIVLGLEGLGTYMIHNALVKAKCVPLAYDGQGQSIDNLGFDISIRQSFPHAGRWPDWYALTRRCERANYDPFIIWIIRETNARIQSVLRRDADREEQHLLDYQWGFFSEASKIRHHDFECELITYSAFVTSEGFRRWLFEERLQLPYPEDFEVLTDRNEQYYK